MGLSQPCAQMQAGLSWGSFLRVVAPRNSQQLRGASGEVAECGNRGASFQQFENPQGWESVSTRHPDQAISSSVQGGSMPRTRQRGEGLGAHPENLPADVGNTVLLQGIPFCVLYQVCHRTSTTKLHHQLWSQGAPEGKASVSQGLLPLAGPWRRTRGRGAKTGTNWRAGAM